MLQLNNLVKTNKTRKRVGRGGDLGGTSGRGHKGQNARSGGGVKASFEGGQMSLSRRLPKRGFTNSFATPVTIVSIKDLEDRFEANATVDEASLRAAGLIKGRKIGKLKVLGNDAISKKLVVVAHGFSKSAAAAIVNAGGEAKRVDEEKQSGSVAS
jgi:large subunit ribosomal protein L15